MPDNKTVYATDDGTNTAFWKFIADKPGDMSSGVCGGWFLSIVCCAVSRDSVLLDNWICIYVLPPPPSHTNNTQTLYGAKFIQNNDINYGDFEIGMC